MKNGSTGLLRGLVRVVEVTGAATHVSVQNAPMDTDLTAVVAALAKLGDGELHALIHATDSVPQTAPGLLAWLEHAADWELNRCGGWITRCNCPRQRFRRRRMRLVSTWRWRCGRRSRRTRGRSPAPYMRYSMRWWNC